MREILAEWNPWWNKEAEFSLIERELKSEIVEWVNRREIVGILGVRRCGKTSLLYLLVKHLLGSVNPKNILFIKCDDERVEKKELISKSIDAYREFLNPSGRVFIFIDEVQEVPLWEDTLKRVYDLEKGIKVFVSGSNFSALKEDIAYKLSGRFAYFDLYPFSFREVLGYKMPSNKAAVLSRKHEIKHYLGHYVEFGGFPEVVLEADKKKKSQLLRFYYDTIVYRDIIKRREIRSVVKMEKMIDLFLQNVSNQANFSKVGKLVSLSTDSVGEYVRHLQDAFFMFAVPLFCFSVKKQKINPKKVYCVDTGIRNVKGFRFSQDYGRLVENIVFIELRRRNCTNPLFGVFYWQNRQHEVDFVVRSGTQIDGLIQVCMGIDNPEVRKMEVDALLAGMSEFRLKTGLIITEDKEGKEVIKGRQVIYAPLWKWLLE